MNTFKSLIFVTLIALGACGDLSTTVEGPCVAGYEQRDYYPRTAVYCGPVGSDAGIANFNPCANGGRPVSWAGGGVVMCEWVDAGH